MTTEMLKQFAARWPFNAFTIHMNDGSRLKVSEPDGVVVPKGWKVNAIVTLGDDRFTIIYLKNIAHVSSRGAWPKGTRSRAGKDSDDL